MTAFHDAEHNVIGACLLSDSAYWQVSDLLTAADFASGWCRESWTLIADLRKANQPADAVTIGDLAESRGSDNGVNFASIVECANTTPSAANVRAYAEIVASKATERRVRDAGTKIAKLSGDEALIEAQAIMQGVAQVEQGTTQNAKAAMGSLVKLMQAQADRDGSLLGVTTGIAGLDDMTCGLVAGDLILVAARPSMGKSMLALQMAHACALSGETAHVVTLEMAATQCLQRLISATAEIPHGIVRDAKQIQDYQWQRVVQASGEIGALPLFFDESVRDFESLVARIVQVHAAHKTRLVVIDYLSHIPLPKAERNDLAIQEVTRRLAKLAKRLKISIVLVAQLNRGLESRADKRPILSDLRESGAIEQDADMVLMLYRDEYHNPDSPQKGYAEILVRKQRNGETGTVPVKAELIYQRFADAPEGLPVAAVEYINRPRRGFDRTQGRNVSGA